MAKINVGDWLYIDTEMYLGHGEDDIRGGLAQVKTVREDGFLEFEGFEGNLYNSTYLLSQQEKWREDFGDQRATKDPDTRLQFNQGYDMAHYASCQCGAVQIKADGELQWSGYCHCNDCRKATGAPVSGFAIFNKQDVAWTGTEPKKYQSSEKVTRQFCGECGSPISYEHTDQPDVIDLYTGLFDDAVTFFPKEHIWESSRLPWLHIQDDLPRRLGA